MVVERSRRRCLLCDTRFTGRAFVCRPCADRYRGKPVPEEVLRRFYREVDLEYPEWANTYGNYNPPVGLLDYLDGVSRDIQVLEVGAGGGYLLDDLRKRGFHRLTGSDITVTSLTEMSRRGSGYSIVGADAEALPFAAQSFDVVVSSDVLEHLPRVNSHLSEVYRILRSGGRYLFKTPNRHPAEMYYRVRGLYDYHIWHPSMQSPGKLEELLRGYGFDVEFLSVRSLTRAQLRKLPGNVLRHVARRIPLDFIPQTFRPHLEVVATRIR